MTERRISASAWRAHAGLALIALLALAAMLIAPTGHAVAKEAIGYVKAASGRAEVAREGRGHALHVGDPVFRQDELITGSDGSLGVTFRDGSRISLGPSTKLALKTFEFEPAEEKLSFVARLAHGTLHFVSGVISKLAPDALSVETPVATIAVRGTNFAVRIPRKGH